MKKILFHGIILLFGTFFFFAEASNGKAASLLKLGSTGQEVYDVQAKLHRMGYLHTNPTGFYGPLTEQAVKDFQYETRLWADGIVGMGTRNQLDNVEMMARVIHGEARGESYGGKVAVAAVILNRKDSPHFPNTIRDVIFQRNAFTAVHDGQYHLTPGNDAYKAAIHALKGHDPTNGSTYYYNPRIATNKWIFSRQTTGEIGNHVFAQ